MRRVSELTIKLTETEAKITPLKGNKKVVNKGRTKVYDIFQLIKKYFYPSR